MRDSTDVLARICHEFALDSGEWEQAFGIDEGGRAGPPSFLSYTGDPLRFTADGGKLEAVIGSFLHSHEEGP